MSALCDQLAEHNRMPPSDGACRLLRHLVLAGLPETALVPAAALVGELELEAADERAASQMKNGGGDERAW